MAFAYSPKIVTDGLVFAVDAANTKSYPGSGTTWKDLSGNGNDGTLINGPTFDSGNGGSIVFDKTNDYVEGPASNSFGFGTNITIECWFKTTESFGINNSSTAGRIVNLHANSPGTNVNIQIGSEGLGFYNIGNATFYNDGIPANTGKWIHGVVVINGINSKLYRNNLVTINVNGNAIPSFSSYPVIIGSYEGSSRFFGGNLALAKLYNRALTASEVSQNYNALKSRFGL
jgi:hypothetical protein